MNYKTIIINLEKDSDRQVYMKKQFMNLGIDFSIFNAIDGKKYLEKNRRTKEYDPFIAISKNKKELSQGELGCALSHKRCVEFLISENKINPNIEYLLICEDDIKITDKNFKRIIEKNIADNEKNKDWEYLQFNYQKPGLAWIISWLNQVINTYKLKLSVKSKLKHLLYSFIKIPFVLIFGTLEGFRNQFYKGNVRFYRDVYFAGCYLINVEGAKKILNLSEKIIYPADKIQNEAKKNNGLKIKYYCPLIVFQQRRKFISNLGR